MKTTLLLPLAALVCALAAAPVLRAEPDKAAAANLADPSKLTEKAPDSFKVKFTTTKGDFTLQLSRPLSPNGVDRFYNLVQAGYFKDIAFFRVIPGFMGQFGIHGDPIIATAWRTANIQDDPVKGSNIRGAITFAKSGAPNSRSTQFFINLVDNPNLDAMGFSPFGKVIEGMDVVDKLNGEYGEGAPNGRGPNQMKVQSEGNAYLKAEFPRLDYIKSATVLTKDLHLADRGNVTPTAEAVKVSYGTGFVVAENGLIVTAAHVVSGGKKITGRFSSGQEFALKLLRIDEKLDLAVLKSVAGGLPVPSFLPIVSSRNLGLGQPVMTIGFPNPDVQGKEPKFTQGTISALTGISDEPNNMQISVPVQPGNSGGALVDMSGRVVGVVVAKLNAIKMARDTGSLSENVNYAVKGSHLLAFLEGLEEADSLNETANTVSPAVADFSTIQAVKKATVFISVEKMGENQKIE